MTRNTISTIKPNESSQKSTKQPHPKKKQQHIPMCPNHKHHITQHLKQLYAPSNSQKYCFVTEYLKKNTKKITLDEKYKRYNKCKEK